MLQDPLPEDLDRITHKHIEEECQTENISRVDHRLLNTEEIYKYDGKYKEAVLQVFIDFLGITPLDDIMK